MQKNISLFLIFLLCFNIIFQNDLILSNAESTEELNLNNYTDTNSSEENLDNSNRLEISTEDEIIQDHEEHLEIPTEDEIVQDSEKNTNHSLSEDSSDNNSSSPITVKSAQPKLNSNAIGSGTINTTTLNVRSGPSTSYNKVGSLYNGDYVEIYARSSGWYKILYNNQFAYIHASYVNLNIIERGIDVSKWNNVVDWNKVKSSGIDYVIIKAGSKYGVDSKFKSHIEGASAAGLKIGIYWFSYATSVSEAKSEAEMCLQTINPYSNKISYPVFFDYESVSIPAGTIITKELANQMANTFIDTINSSGYEAGLYTNPDFIQKYFNTNILYSTNVWLSNPNSQSTFNKPYMMWQYSFKGSINGINGDVDLNYTYLKSMKQEDGFDPTTENSINYKTHIEDYGWQSWKSNGKTSGTTGQNKHVEAIQLELANSTSNASIVYQTHVADYGWLDWKSNGQIAGTVGENKQVEAIRIYLDNMPGYSVKYRVHVQDYGWLDWTYNGEIAGTVGENKQVEAIEVEIIKSDEIALKYKTHIQDYGWLDWTYNGETSGTTGQNKQVEAIQLKLDNAPLGAKISYQTHVQDYGWLDWTSNGQIAGTTSQNKQVEAIKINLENIPGYSIKYRVHVEDYGWLDWKSNGEIAGTVGENKQIEAIEVKLIKQ